ncbi:MAG: type IV pilus assembly protein PilM [Gammaproteobacteria bacterium]
MFDLGLWLERKIFKIPECIAIDIGSSAIKVMQIVLDQDEYQINHHAIESIPPNIVIDKNIKDVDTLAARLQDLLTRHKIQAKSAVVAVGGGGVVTRTIQLAAALSETEIEGEVYLEAQRYIPFDLEEAYFDYQVIGPSSKGPELIDVLLVAAKKNVIENKLALLELVKLKPYIVDIESLALERAAALILDQLPPFEPDQKIGLLDIGANSMTLSVMENKNIIYSREQNFGGKQLTDEIQLRYGISFEEVSLLNKTRELPDDYFSEVLEPFKLSIIQQINRALQFFYSSDQHGELSHLILFGGVSKLDNLEEMVKNETKIKTIVGNPCTKMKLGKHAKAESLEQEASSLLTAVGLCLRAIYDNRN